MHGLKHSITLVRKTDDDAIFRGATAGAGEVSLNKMSRFMPRVVSKLDETSLPPKEAFYSKLTGECITDEDYQHAQTVWKEFYIESMKDYHNLYNLCDVLLLPDIC